MRSDPSNLNPVTGLLPDLSIIHNCITLHLVVAGFNLLNKHLDQTTLRSLLDLGFFLAFCGRLKDRGLVSFPWEPGESTMANPEAGREGCHRAALVFAKPSRRPSQGPAASPSWVLRDTLGARPRARRPHTKSRCPVCSLTLHSPCVAILVIHYLN